MRGKASTTQPSRWHLSPSARTFLSTILPPLALASSLFSAAYLFVTTILLAPDSPNFKGNIERSLGYLLIVVGYLLIPGVTGLLVRRHKAVAAERALLHAGVDTITQAAPSVSGRCTGSGPFARLLPAGRILADVDDVAPSTPWTGECDKQCAVCLADVEEKEEARELLCGHVFHSGCAEQWLVHARRNCCPMCMRKVVQGRDEDMCCVKR